MTIIREFISNFTKIKRTFFLLIHLLPPIVVTTLFFVYYTNGGYKIFYDVRLFFVILQLCQPIFVSIVVPILIHLDRDINNMQNTLGLVDSKASVYLGTLFFLLFFSAISMILYELCFYISVNWVLDIGITQLNFYLILFFIFLFSNMFLYLLHVTVTFKFGSSICVLLGISGTILAGYFENAIGDNIWPFIPWEWGVRFFKHYFQFSSEPISLGIILSIIITILVLVLSLLWFGKWEGNIIQE